MCHESVTIAQDTNQWYSMVYFVLLTSCLSPSSASNTNPHQQRQTACGNIQTRDHDDYRRRKWELRLTLMEAKIRLRKAKMVKLELEAERLRQKLDDISNKHM